jgi:hypothetical protein
MESATASSPRTYEMAPRILNVRAVRRYRGCHHAAKDNPSVTAPRKASAPAVAAVSVRRILFVAPVAVRVRRSPALSLRISPTVMARIASARRAPAAVAMAIGFAYDALSRRASIVRPARAASSRAAAICSLVNGRLDSTSQPDGICFQPWRRRPSTVTNEAGAWPESLLGEPRSCRLSILWTFVTAM